MPVGTSSAWGDTAPFESPPRTSVLAASALVLALLGCLPGAGLLAVVLGVVALWRIRLADGRLGGRTLALAGVGLGALFTLLWTGVGVGAVRGYASLKRGLLDPVADVLAALEAGRWDQVRPLLHPERTVSEAELEAFRDRVRATFGRFRGLQLRPDVSMLFMPQPPGIPPHAGVLPVSVRFDQGPVVAVIVVDTPDVLAGILGGQADVLGHAHNLALADRHRVVWLVEPLQPAPPAPASRPGPQGNADSPDDHR